MSETSVGQFLRAFTRSWFTKMSGPMAVPLTIGAVLAPQAWLRVFLASTAIACGTAASYSVWRREREGTLRERAALQAEKDRNQRPDIRIRIEHVIVQRHHTRNTVCIDGRQTTTWECFITVVLHCTNSRPQEATIDKLSLVVETPNRAFPAQLLASTGRSGTTIHEFKHLQEIEANLVVRQGVGATRLVRFITEERDSDNIEHAGRLKLGATDSFDIEHTAEWSAQY